MTRKNFTKSVKVQALRRSGGSCEVHLFQEHKHTQDIKHLFPVSCEGVAKDLDHVLADCLDGEPILENGAYLCKSCHKIKSGTDAGYKAKRDRHTPNFDKPKTMTRPKQKFGKRDNVWPNKDYLKKIGGKVIRRMK